MLIKNFQKRAHISKRAIIEIKIEASVLSKHNKFNPNYKNGTKTLDISNNLTPTQNYPLTTSHLAYKELDTALDLKEDRRAFKTSLSGLIYYSCHARWTLSAELKHS